MRLYCSPSRFDWWGDNCSMQALRERLPSSVGLCWKDCQGEVMLRDREIRELKEKLHEVEMKVKT